MKLFWFSYLLFTCSFVPNVVAADGIYGPYDADYLSTVDGDTIKVVLYIYPGQTVSTTIRERTIDTPELRRSPKCEKALAVQASDYTRMLLENATKVTVDALGYGTFQPRMVGIIYVDDKPLGSLLREHGHAVKYEDRKAHKWC